MIRTLLTRKQQSEWIANNQTTLIHSWNCRNMGFSRISTYSGSLATASGCGYDRLGAVIGKAITELFPAEIHKLAKSLCIGKRRNYKQPKSQCFYGLFYNAETGKAWVDGGCGKRQIENILAAIGFSLDYVGGDKGSKNVGTEYYELRPVSTNTLKWLEK